MKSRATKSREAWQLIAWVGGVVTGLLILYGLTEGTPPTGIGIMVPLITVAGTLTGVLLGSRLSQRLRIEEEQRRRQTLATALLSEVRFLEGLLRDITTAVIPGEPGEEIIEPYRTAVYDSAGANLLLFSRETVYDLDALYQLVHRLREELKELRRGQIDAGVDHYHTAQLRAIYAVAYMRSNCSTRLEEGTDGRKCFLNRLKSGQALTFAGIHDRAHGRKQVSPPVGAETVGDLPKDGTHADGLLAGVIRRRNGGILQKHEQVVPNLGIAFLQASPMGVGGLAG